jgi:mono/diheme cytochrome c family protein
MNRIIQTAALAGLAFLATAASAAAADSKSAVVQHGSEVFAKWCAPCHGKGPGDQDRPMLPGTEALAAKYKGEKPAAIEDRTDLPLEVLQVFVRQGVWSMPGFRKSEVSDDDIKAIAAYIADSARKNAKKR